MLRNKRILLILILAIALFLIPSICNASDTFTTSEGIVATKEVNNFKGNIDFKISNIELSDEGNYVWGISPTSAIEKVTNWYSLGDFNSNKKTATISLVISENKILEILRATNNAWLFIKDNDNNSMIIDSLKVDLTLPPFYAFDVMVHENGSIYINGGEKCSVDRWKAATYNIENVYYSIKEVTDENLISRFKEALVAGTSVSSVFNITIDQIKDVSNWDLCNKEYYFYNQIPSDDVPDDAGVYILYMKAKDTDSKTIYGYRILNVDAVGPTVEKIYVNSPESGTYATGQTVKIRVGFSEPITGSTVPTLNIKFGDSAVREVSNGTIVNSGSGSYYWQHYIEYSYDIKDSDKGQLATVELIGGNIKDSSGNEATLSCPLITGNTIKANVEGTNNNQTDNLDKENNTQTSTVTLSSIAITKTPTKNTYLEGETFDKNGMVITATYSNGSTKQITNYSVSPSVALKTTDKKVLITYTENGVTKSVEQKITVLAKGTNNNTSNNKDNSNSKDDTVKDTTIKNDNKLPQTGVTILSLVAISLIAVAVISKVKYGKYKDI